jgi:hypothetical protein
MATRNHGETGFAIAAFDVTEQERAVEMLAKEFGPTEEELGSIRTVDALNLRSSGQRSQALEYQILQTVTIGGAISVMILLSLGIAELLPRIPVNCRISQPVQERVVV